MRKRAAKATRSRKAVTEEPPAAGEPAPVAARTAQPAPTAQRDRTQQEPAEEATTPDAGAAPSDEALASATLALRTATDRRRALRVRLRPPGGARPPATATVEPAGRAQSPAEPATAAPETQDVGPDTASVGSRAALVGAALVGTSPMPHSAPQHDQDTEADRPGVDWSAAELGEVRGELQDQAAHLRGEIDAAESASAALQRASAGESPGDEADAGTKTFEREHEMSLANNSRGLLTQVERALARVDDGTYGHCESCGTSIPKPRLQAFPRATLCVTCKQREERR